MISGLLMVSEGSHITIIRDSRLNFFPSTDVGKARTIRRGGRGGGGGRAS